MKNVAPVTAEFIQCVNSCQFVHFNTFTQKP
ncbi:hypothetical protein D6029_01460 [Buttiauxella izardii]|uniref:Uncharacterized protein n=1 Tax=Buttiauxella izardii TaxID=82991 RepID=A0A3A5JZ09_9ENTR|nr:hypothetical protein D6029_01460 [Buttiauxella izardii]